MRIRKNDVRIKNQEIELSHGAFLICCYSYLLFDPPCDIELSQKVFDF